MPRGAFILCASAVAALAGAACGLPSDGTAPVPPPGSGNYAGGSKNSPTSPPPPGQVDNDAGTLVGRRGTDAGETDAAPRSGDAGGGADAGADSAPDAPPPVDSAASDAPVLCASPPGPGDLAIVELMIESVGAHGDQGEWLELQSTRSDCTLNLLGLHAESPRTTSPPLTPDTLDVTEPAYLPPGGIFVIADSLDPTINNYLPTAPMLFAWASSPADVLQNGGDEVKLSLGAAVIQDLTYPAFDLVVGTSITFPADCTWGDLGDWSRWSYSNNFWYGAFQGTPNASNTDATCY